MTVAPLFLPFAVAILFGNLDAWYPLAYGALLLTILARPSKLTLAAAGAAIAVVASRSSTRRRCCCGSRRGRGRSAADRRAGCSRRPP